MDELRPNLLIELTELAVSSPLLPLRGSALFGLGLLSGSSSAAREQLSQLGWESPRLPSSCITLPSDPTRLLSLAADDPLGSARYALIAPVPEAEIAARQVRSA